MRFAASRGVVGVPAKWLVAQEREIPPANDQQARAILRLQAERLSASGQGDMVFDYAGQPNADRPGKLLLVGMLRPRLELIEKVMEAAGISTFAITPTALALAWAVGQARTDAPMIILGRHGTEIIWHCSGSPRALRHVGAFVANGHASSVAPLTAELRRIVALAPAGGNGKADEVLLVDGVGLSASQIDEFSERLGLPVRASDGLAVLGVQAAPAFGSATSLAPAHDQPAPGHYAPAVSLALAAARRDPLTPDFQHSRLAPPRQRRIGRRTTWAIILATITVATLLSLYVLVQRMGAEHADLQAQLKRLDPDIKAAEQMLERVKFAKGFFDTRPPMLDCLKEITLAFRDDEPIWAASFVFREGGKGQLMGRAADQKTILKTIDRLKENPTFTDVKAPEIREVGGKSRDWSFSVSFSFTQ
jgi:hypothetical protein